MLLKTSSLIPSAAAIICEKATERPFSGEYAQAIEEGSYLCKQCGLALFRSASKFDSSCGWPSFDAEIKDCVTYIADADGQRTEILCARCGGHLGHVFQGEHYTIKNTRHCVNSLSLDFVADSEIQDTEEIIVAGGCFWGLAYYLAKVFGVLKTEVGYTGGRKDHPSYSEICRGDTGHLEAVRVIYDPQKITYQTLLQNFFKIHDPTQSDGQGPDIGSQYLSAIFYYNETQKKLAEQAMAIFESTAQKVCTRVLPVSIFWPAEAYHQNYYGKTRQLPYCHRPGSTDHSD
jgi:peptide methionine sulfoxide reductase msrA/msrB